MKRRELVLRNSICTQRAGRAGGLSRAFPVRPRVQRARRARRARAQVLEEGSLQPVIGLLSSKCTESQREAALLLGQFATTEPDFKAKIVQRGAVPPLITMLGHPDVQLKEMAAFALGRLAQNQDNQAGIVQARLCRTGLARARREASCAQASITLGGSMSLRM